MFSVCSVVWCMCGVCVVYVVFVVFGVCSVEGGCGVVYVAYGVRKIFWDNSPHATQPLSVVQTALRYTPLVAHFLEKDTNEILHMHTTGHQTYLC